MFVIKMFITQFSMDSVFSLINLIFMCNIFSPFFFTFCICILFYFFPCCVVGVQQREEPGCGGGPCGPDHRLQERGAEGEVPGRPGVGEELELYQQLAREAIHKLCQEFIYIFSIFVYYAEEEI